MKEVLTPIYFKLLGALYPHQTVPLERVPEICAAIMDALFTAAYRAVALPNQKPARQLTFEDPQKAREKNLQAPTGGTYLTRLRYRLSLRRN